MPSTNEALWTVVEVTTYLKVSRSWVYQKTAAGELPHVRIGRLVRFVPEQIRTLATRDTQATVTQLRR